MASRSKTGRGATTVPIFLLVPQMKLPKRLDLARYAERMTLCRGSRVELGGGACAVAVCSCEPLKTHNKAAKIETPGGGSPDLVL